MCVSISPIHGGDAGDIADFRIFTLLRDRYKRTFLTLHTVDRAHTVRANGVTNQRLQLDRVGEARKKKALAAMTVLGFKSPSFSFGIDVILPGDVNRELRNFLLSDPATVKDDVSTSGDSQAVHALGKVPGVHVPEVSKRVC